jgi:NADH:ubiquinone oxidoreductase subunit K
METLFKTLLVIAVIVFCLLVVGVFLLLVKIFLLFNTELNLLGLTITY